MSDQILAALIGAVVVILVAIIPYVVKLISRLRAERQSNLMWGYLKGSWDGEWECSTDGSKKEKINDVVTFNKIRGNKILGTGYAYKEGTYDIEGTANHLSILFTYKAVGENVDDIGAFLLIKEGDNNHLSGKWLQYEISGQKIIYGDVVFTKQK
ncbi:MAG: hypothetical protein COA57_13815 [Flavobacteriales bacterium]|nr:MAG: hypothetical protein COA57_13815 [Flavobacteriales bacterium]